MIKNCKPRVEPNVHYYRYYAVSGTPGPAYHGTTFEEYKMNKIINL
jgi:hypothetical protein